MNPSNVQIRSELVNAARAIRLAHHRFRLACEVYGSRHARSAEMRRAFFAALEALPDSYGRLLREREYRDADLCEYAVCTLEIRPYFFRSQYQYQKILRRTKRAPLDPFQRARLDVVLRIIAERRLIRSIAKTLPCRDCGHLARWHHTFVNFCVPCRTETAGLFGPCAAERPRHKWFDDWTPPKPPRR